ncbi:MAG: hypothetical protein EXX96DRAFT_511490 [Benjaminiella poitrasii]|nr:MAG: hypothetical protein EXX96DRAFT_511490 [Benjaminiella poitrasii]
MGNFSLPSSINSPLPTSLKGECKKATKILHSFIDPGQGLDIIIPRSILEKAQGLAIFTVLKAGFLFSGRAGSGLVIASLVCSIRYSYRWYGRWWSNRFCSCFKYQRSFAAGPVGRNVEASGSATFKHISAVYSYSKTRGLFAGVSLEGSVIFTRNDANEKLYGQRYSAKELLNGTVPPPHEADALYRALNAKLHSLGNTGAMYQRALTQNEGNQLYKNSTISAPGTLRIPPVRQAGGYGTPNVNYNSTTISIPAVPVSNESIPTAPPVTKQQQSIYSTPPQSTYASPTPSYSQPPPPVIPSPPPSYVSPKPSYTPPSFQNHNAQRAASPPLPSQALKPQRARALYPFVAEQEGDLSFQQDDIIIIIEKTDSKNDWWSGKLSTNGQIGSFPANYVEML